MDDTACRAVHMSGLLTELHRERLGKDAQMPPERASYIFLLLGEGSFITPSTSDTDSCYTHNKVSFSLILMGLQKSLQ